MSNTLLIHGGRLPVEGALGPGHVVVADGRIVTAAGTPWPRTPAATLDASGCTVLPGLIDVHVHGALGADTMDADPAGLARMARFFAHHGVTAFLATTMTASHAETLAAVQAVAAAGSRPDVHGATCLGVHLEGPYISPRFPGAQPSDAIRDASLDEFAEWVAAGPVRMITLAPEQPGGHDLVRDAVRRGIVAVTGHTAATYEECEAAIAAGVTQATHTYNAMTGLHHRRPGTLGSVLTNDAVYAQLIADNIHVHPAAMKVLARCKGVGRTVLITDAMRAAGLPAGGYTLGGQPVTVTNGECRLPDGTLAGSVLTMEKGLANFLAAAGWDLATGWPASSASAAASLGIADERGRLAPGVPADLVLLDDALTVVATVVGGSVVYLRDAERLGGDCGDQDPDGPGSL